MPADPQEAHKATVSRPHGLLFLMNPVTACSAVGKVMRERLQGEWLPAEPLLAPSGEVLVRRKHCTLAELRAHQLVTPDEAERWVKFTTVRNPFEVELSRYVKRRVRFQALLEVDSRIRRDPRIVDEVRFCAEHTFEEWLERLHGARTTEKRGYFRFAEGVDVVMRHERLDQDFQQVLERVGVKEEIRIPRFHETEGKPSHYRDHYTPRARALVEKAYRSALEAFEYQF